MAKTEKSKAEIYRQERKDRISSAAKKNAKKSRKHPNAGKVAGRIVGIVIALAIVAGVGYFVLDNTGIIARSQTAFTIGSHKVSVAEYGYMYYMQYQNTANQAQQSEQNYGYNIYGFDYKKSPEDQDSPYKDDDDNTITWAKQLEKNTEDYMQEFYAIYDNCVKEGYKLTDEEKADIDENIEGMRSTAAGSGSTTQGQISMSLNSYLKVYYGKGITENFLRDLMEKEMLVQRYSEDKQDSFEEKYDDKTVDEEYNKDTTAYDAVDLRMYAIETEELTGKEGETEEALQKRQDAENKATLAKATAMLEEVTDEASFTAAAEVLMHEAEAEEAKTEEADAAPAEDAAEAEEAPAAEEVEEEHDHDHESQTRAYGVSKSSLTSSVSEDAAKWAFAKGRKAGDKKAFTAQNGNAYALYVVKPAYAQECVDVRHILLMTVDSSSGEKLSNEEIADKKAQAQKLVADWEALDADKKTEDAFAELANENSEDTGSNTNGGLYENVTPGQMVDSFDKWIFDTKRNEGDVELVESEYGYHIMYYVGNRDLAYRENIRTSHSQDDYSSWLEGELKTDAVKITENVSGMEKGYARAKKLIDATVASINANAAN